MAVDNYRKRQIRKCLDCKIGFDVIWDYKDLYGMAMKEEEIRFYLKDIDSSALEKLPKLLNLPDTGESTQKQLQHVSEDDIFEAVLDEDGTRVVEELSEILGITGAVREKYNVLKQLSQSKGFGEEELDICLGNLQPIIHALCAWYEKSGDNEDNILMGKAVYTKYIFSIMHELNEKRNSGYDGERGSKALKLFGSEDEEKYEKEIVKNLREIFKEFRLGGKETYDIMTRGECFLKEIDEVARVYDKVAPSRSDFFERLDRLGSESGEILLEYIRHAPKKVGVNFRIAMEKQHMSENDILKFINEMLPHGAKRKKISAVQNIAKAIAPNDTETIRLVCKALLISEDVLYKGTGKRYGDLGELLSDEMVGDIKELAQENGIEEVTCNKTDTAMRKFFKKKIKTMVENSGMDLQKLTEIYPDLFQEEDYCLYDDNNKCFDSLLHKEEALALLEVLERMGGGK